MTIRAAVVGVGQVGGGVHVPIYAEHDRVELVALSDIDEEAATDVAKSHSVPRVYTDATKMIEEETLDAISICSPPNTHEELFLSAVDQDTAVLCEKPTAPSLDAAERMAEAARRAGIVTQTGHVLNYFNNYRSVIRLVQNGLLGDVLKVNTVYQTVVPGPAWYQSRSIAGGGVVTDKFPHLLGFFFELFDDESPTVVRSDCHSNRSGEVEDIADVSLEFGDVSVDVSVGWTQGSPDGRRSYRKTVLTGTNGIVELNRKKLSGNVNGERILHKHGLTPTVDLGEEVGQYWRSLSEDHNKRRIEQFVECVETETSPDSDIQRGLSVVRTIDDIYRTAGVRG